MPVSRSRNSYILSPRSVTMQPIAMPLRILKFAMDFFARVITGFCPVICPSSAAAVSSSFTFALASPIPMFTVTFCTRGTAIVFFKPKRFKSAGTASLRYFSCKRVIISRPYLAKKSLAFKSRVAAPARTHLGSIRQRRVPRARVLAASRADQQHVRHMHWPFLLQNSTLDVLRRVRTRVLLDHVRVLYRHRQFPGIHRKHFPGLPLRAPGHDLHQD